MRGLISLKSLDLTLRTDIHIPGYDHGGMIPGYDHGGGVKRWVQVCVKNPRCFKFLMLCTERGGGERSGREEEWERGGVGERRSGREEEEGQGE